MRWFGDTWDAHVNTTCEHISTPVDQHCEYCHQLIGVDDQGFELPLWGAPGDLRNVVYYHRDCLLRNVGFTPAKVKGRT